MNISPPILVILGPTASGKSDLAMAVARQTKAEILSVDSMQVYRGMDIGTAKPSLAERAEIRHHLIDVVEPRETFTAARFVVMADAVIADAANRRVPLIATGGTPLYYKLLFQGLFEGPGADESIRDRLRGLPNESLHQQLTAVDPAAAERIHVNDLRRLIRALEVHELTGHAISSFQTEWDSPQIRHQAIWIGLSWERDALNKRINLRVKKMLAGGWIEEARGLLEEPAGGPGGLSAKPFTAFEATGYRQLIAHLNKEASLDQTIEAIKIATRQLARRQMKWFRRFRQVHWIAADRPIEKNVEEILQRWKDPSVNV